MGRVEAEDAASEEQETKEGRKADRKQEGRHHDGCLPKEGP